MLNMFLLWCLQILFLDITCRGYLNFNKLKINDQKVMQSDIKTSISLDANEYYITRDISNFAVKISDRSANAKLLNKIGTKLIVKYSSMQLIHLCVDAFTILDSINIADTFTHTALMTAFIK